MKWISRSTIYICVTLTSSLWSPSQLFAESETSGWVVSPALLYREEARSRSESASFNLFLLELRAGFTFSNSLFVGGLYGNEQEMIRADNYPVTNQSSQIHYNRTVMGLSVGYVRYDYYLIGSVLGSGSWSYSNGSSTVTYGGGLGAQLDLGVNFKIGDVTWIGPRLTYRLVQYRSITTSDSASVLDPPLQRAVIDPYFVVWFQF